MKTYTVKEGDYLIKIAAEQDVEYPELLELNRDLQDNPDLIRPGDTVNLPDPPEKKSETKKETECGPEYTPPIYVDKEGADGVSEACQPKDIADVIFVTGDDPYVLSKTQQKEILDDVKENEAIMKEHRDLIDKGPKAPKNNEAAKAPGKTAEEAYEEAKATEAHRKAKHEWMIKGHEAGLFKLQPAATETKAKACNEDYFNDRLKKLAARRKYVEGHFPIWLPGWDPEDEKSHHKLAEQRLKAIKKEIATVQADIEAVCAKDPETSKTTGGAAKTNTLYGKTLYISDKTYGVTEVMLASTGKLSYIKTSLLQAAKGRWSQSKKSSSVQAFASSQIEASTNGGGETEDKTKISAKELSKALFADIKNDLKNDAAKTALGKIEANWNLYEAPKEWQLGCHREFKKQSLYQNVDALGNVHTDITGEAHFMRFAMQASTKADLSGISKGNVDIGLTGEAELNLAEAKLEVEHYVPNQTGYHLTFSYQDANKKDALYSFGSFRFNAKVELSCSVGAEANAGLIGAVILTPDPSIEEHSKRKGEFGLKAGAFAGAKAGGTFSGGLEWENPSKTLRGKFKALATVTVGGNLSAGLGASAEFKLVLERGKFVFVCSAQIVFGPGGSGSFSTGLDFKELLELLKVIWAGLDKIGYHLMHNLDSDSYDYLSRVALYAFATPRRELYSAMEAGVEAVDEWWGNRTEGWKDDEEDYKIAEARQLALSILDDKTLGDDLSLNQLPPETIGIMMNTLVQTWLKTKEEEQETAICKLLNESIQSWRKFEEVLARMNPLGEKKDGDENVFFQMARINTILDFGQQKQFNDWVVDLAENDRAAKAAIIAIRRAKKAKQVRAQAKAMKEAMALITEQSKGTKWSWANGTTPDKEAIAALKQKFKNNRLSWTKAPKE